MVRIVEASGAVYTREEILATFPIIAIDEFTVEDQAPATLAPGEEPSRDAEALATLREEMETLSQTPEGGGKWEGRNAGLHVAAMKLGHLVPHRLSYEQDVKPALIEACVLNGLIAADRKGGLTSVLKTIRSGLRKGMQQPRYERPTTTAEADFSDIDLLALNAGETPKADPDFKLYSAADIKPETIEWIWKDRIPRGMTSIVGGMPGLGKSQFMFALAAAITTGGTMPDGSKAELGNVVLVNAEDHPSKTLVPRLIAAGADLKRVRLLEGVYDPAKPCEKRRFDVKQMPALKQLIRDIGNVTLVIIDPIMSYLGGGKNSDKDDEVRTALFDLNQMAEDANFAVILVTHLNKGSGGHVLDRIMGSRAFTGLPRSVWLILEDPDDEERSILALGKTNVGPKTIPGIAYAVTTVTIPEGIEAQKLAFESEPERRKADDLLNPERKSFVEEACEWLKAALSDGPKTSKQLAKEAKDAGISEYALKEARKKLRVRPIKGDGANASWMMALPTHVGGTNADEEFADMADWQENPDRPLH
jgi:AAA domain